MQAWELKTFGLYRETVSVTFWSRSWQWTLRLTQAGGEARVCLGDVDAVIEDVGGGGGGLGVAEHDGVVEGGGVRWLATAWWPLLRGPRGELSDRARCLVSLVSSGHSWGRDLLLLDAGRGRALGPAPGPHAGVAGVGLVLGPGPLHILGGLQVTVDVSVVWRENWVNIQIPAWRWHGESERWWCRHNGEGWGCYWHALCALTMTTQTPRVSDTLPPPRARQ